MSAVHGTGDSSCKSCIRVCMYIATQWNPQNYHYYFNLHYKLKSDENVKVLHLKLLLKTWALCLWVLYLHISDDCPKFMGNHSSVSTVQVVIESIMDERILVLWKDHAATDDKSRTVLYSLRYLCQENCYMHELSYENLLDLSQILQRNLNTILPDSNLSRQQSMFKYKSYYND